MKLLIAPDKFKGSMTAIEAAQSIQESLKRAGFTGETVLFPMADGGEGTIDILAHHSECTFHKATVTDPLFRKIQAKYALDQEHKKAFMEMSSASGLQLLAPEERNCRITTSYGTGELIKAAFIAGAEEIILGIGGSATNDGGIGMACALGYRFLDRAGKEIVPVGENLIHVFEIDDSDLHDVVFDSRIKVACDVSAPLYGPEGAAYMYASQKGAGKEDIELLDQGLRHLAEIVEHRTRKRYSMVPGAGAAGGLGFGLMAFCNSLLMPGFELVARLTRFRDQLQACDLVITGEGKLDQQTFQGKTVEGIRTMALNAGKPLMIIAGIAEAGIIQNPPEGIIKVLTLFDKPPSASDIIIQTKERLDFIITRLVKELF